MVSGNGELDRNAQYGAVRIPPAGGIGFDQLELSHHCLVT